MDLNKECAKMLDCDFRYGKHAMSCPDNKTCKGGCGKHSKECSYGKHGNDCQHGVENFPDKTKIQYASVSIQGWRKTQEDYVAMWHNIDTRHYIAPPPETFKKKRRKKKKSPVKAPPPKEQNV